MLRQMTDALGGKPVVVMGDFNCGRGSPPYEVLTADNHNLAELTDTYAALEYPEEGAGTFNDFAGHTDSPRIDWILCNRRFEVREATIDRRAFNGQYPSDHFPITATLRLQAATSSGGNVRISGFGVQRKKQRQWPVAQVWHGPRPVLLWDRSLY